MSRRPKCLNRLHCSNLIEHHVSSVKVTQSLLNKSGKTRHFQCSIDSSKHNFVMGRSKVEVLVLTLTRRTKPSLSGNTSVIRPTGHTFLGVDSFVIHDNHVSNSEVCSWSKPFLAFLQQRKIFSFPATPEHICQILHLTPSSPGISVVLFKQPWW